MTRPERYGNEDLGALREAFADGRPLCCPVCDVPMDRREVPPRSDVSYVRDRLWVSCPKCHRSEVLDRKQPR